MTTNPQYGNDPAQEVIYGIEAALDAADLTHRDLDHDGWGQIRFNKLVFIGLHWRYGDDIPLQYSWHRYGPNFGNSLPKHTTLTVRPEEQLPGFSESPTGPSPEKARRIREYFYLFERDFPIEGMEFEDAVEMDLQEFLEAFYDKYADEVYRNVYVANVEFQRFLSGASESLELHAVTEEDCIRLGEVVTRLHGELFSLSNLRKPMDDVEAYVHEHPSLDRTYGDLPALAEKGFDRMEVYTNLVEDIFMMMAEQSAEDVYGSPENIVEGLETFYHEYAWKYISELISIRTASEKNKQALWNGALEEIIRLDEQYENRLYNHEQLAMEAGLLPSIDDYQFNDDSHDTERVVRDVVSVYTDDSTE